MLAALLALINLMVSVGVPLWVTKTSPKTFTSGEAYLLGAVLFVATTVAETSVLAAKAFVAQRELSRLWTARANLDARLQEVRRLFHEVEERRVGDIDLFVSYFDKKLADLEAGLRDVCSNNEVTINETMIQVTDWLYKASFHGRDQDIFRAVHLTKDTDFFFDIHVRRYFRNIYNLVKEKKVKEVRRLIVYRSTTSLSDARTQKLIAFHLLTSGYDCRLLDDDTFHRLARDFELPPTMSDFGIYGSTYVYKGLIAQRDEILGTYSHDAVSIRQFIWCFDACWDAAERPRSPTDEKIDLDELFAHPLVLAASLPTPASARGTTGTTGKDGT